MFVWNLWLYFEKDIDLIDLGCKMFCVFFIGVGDELIWIVVFCVYEDGVLWVGFCDYSN